MVTNKTITQETIVIVLFFGLFEGRKRFIFVCTLKYIVHIIIYNKQFNFTAYPVYLCVL